MTSVRLLPANNASPWTGPTGTNTFLLTGRVPALVDAGVGDARHLENIESALNGRPLARLLITHGHPDHVDGLAAVLHRWPSTDVIRFGHSGDIVECGDTRLRIVHTPGHAPDHLCFFDEASRDVYCGDLVRRRGLDCDSRKQRRQCPPLPELAGAGPIARTRRLLPGHGPIIDDPVASIDQYIQHRAAREAEMIAALGDGLMTPEEMCREFTESCSPMLSAAAADSILAHLVKLHDEERAYVSDDGWRLA